jgi:peptidoglycan/LPS O-acetylase OafA/YrhL
MFQLDSARADEAAAATPGEVALVSEPAVKMPVVPELEGIRAIAVAIVFVSHVGFGHIVPGGLGVTIFFFLSGYLITSLLRSEAATCGKIDLWRFYVRRTLRIMPPLYLTLLFSGLLVAVGLVPIKLDAGSVLSQIFFLANYERLWGPHQGFPIPLWSLAVEEHFYLVFPFVFATLLMRLSGKRAATYCLVACGATLIFRLIQGLYPGGLELNYFLTHTRIDSILFGCCLAMWNNPVLDRDRAWRPNLVQFVIAGLAILAAAAIRDPYFGDTMRYTIQGIGLFVVFSFILHGNALTSAVLNWTPMQVIGRLSYTIYLIHVVIRITVDKSFGMSGLSMIIATAAGTFAFAWVMFVLVERPLARARKRMHREVAPAPMEELIRQR